MKTLKELERWWNVYPSWAEPEREFSEKALETLRFSEERRLAQADEIMTLQADLSTARTTIVRMQAAVEQHWRDATGHNHCIRNNPRLWEEFGLAVQPKALPPRDEFERGCATFADELYRDHDRWPDFFELATSGSSERNKE